MFLPRSTLEALYIRRISPVRQLRVSCVSDSRLINGGTILTLLQNDYGRYSTEYLYSTDSGLLGARGLYNFGTSQRMSKAGVSPTENGAEPTYEPMHGRFSAGAEVYYGMLNKSGGISTGLRFTTLPTHTGFPYTMTLTLNPLMGNLSSTYAVKAGRNLSLCSRFDFNFYSYESDLQLGCELWRRQQPSPETEWARRLIRPEWKKPRQDHGEGNRVLKARLDQNWRVGVLWEGRVKELLFSLGASFDLKRREHIFRTVGVELQYSS